MWQTATKKTVTCVGCKLVHKSNGASYTYSEGATGRLVWEHRVVAERILGRVLKSHEVVHHVSGDGTDNALTNLIVLTRGSHVKLHRFLDRQKLITIGSSSTQVWEGIKTMVSLNWLQSAEVNFILLSDLA
jgi:hypothetical protein